MQYDKLKQLALLVAGSVYVLLCAIIIGLLALPVVLLASIYAIVSVFIDWYKGSDNVRRNSQSIKDN